MYSLAMIKKINNPIFQSDLFNLVNIFIIKLIQSNLKIPKKVSIFLFLVLVLLVSQNFGVD